MLKIILKPDRKRTIMGSTLKTKSKSGNRVAFILSACNKLQTLHFPLVQPSQWRNGNHSPTPVVSLPTLMQYLPWSTSDNLVDNNFYSDTSGTLRHRQDTQNLIANFQVDERTRHRLAEPQNSTKNRRSSASNSGNNLFNASPPSSTPSTVAAAMTCKTHCGDA